MKHGMPRLIISAALGFAVGSSAVMADDIEAYRVEESDPIGPNMLFVLDESGSMKWNASGSSSLSDTDSGQRMYQLKEAMCAVIASEKTDNVSAAILGYRSSSMILTEHSEFVRVKDNRAALLQVIGNTAHNGPRCNAAFSEYGVSDSGGTLVHSGGTPSSPALRYGMDWYRDSNRSPNDKWCEPNYIVFITDGDPNVNTSATTYGGENCSNHDTNYNWSGTDGSDWGAKCSETISWWGYTHRPKDDTDWVVGDNDPELKKFRNVITHTVGIYATAGTSREQYLINVAQESLDADHPTYNFSNDYGKDLSGYDPDDPYTGGRYVRASAPEDLIDAFSDFVDQAQREVTYTYTAPSIPFSPDNAAITGNYIYVPMFTPDSKTLWGGNLKKYKIGKDSDGNLFIRDYFNESVVSSDLLFRNTQDLWGSTKTTDPLIGGAASHQTGTRKLYTRLGTDNTNMVLVHKDTNAVDSDGNEISPATPAITEAMLGASDNTEREQILDWISWVAEAHRGKMGAPLHTTPSVVRYTGENDLVLLPTTEGILHAFDGETGAEVWSFMPDEILSLIKTMKSNPDTQEPPLYGLDGPMKVYRYNNHTYVTVGMRRGGRNYYTLDITDRETPEFAWEIRGGQGSFSKLAQTWSMPILTKLDLAKHSLDTNASSEKVYMIFGGGYNATVQDTDAANAARVEDTVGDTIFVVDPGTGALVTSSLVGDISNSIPSDILPVDINANGITDRLYFAGVGGRVYRVDVPDDAFPDASDSLSWGVIADINANADGNSTGTLRKFFNTPEVGYFSRGGVQYLAVLIGSGNRPEPLDNDVTDRFYMIKDLNVWTGPLPDPDTGVIAYTKVAADQLKDATDTPDSNLADKQGWFIDVEHEGENYKVLSKARLYDNAVMFTTYRGYVEGDVSNDACVASSAKGKSAFFAVDMTSGNSIFADMDGNDDNLVLADRSKSLNIPGMPPSPSLLFPADNNGKLGGEVISIVGLEEVQRWPDRFHPVTWEECGADNCGDE